MNLLVEKKDVSKYKQQLLNPPDLLGAPLLPTSKLEVEAPTIDCQVLSVSERNMWARTAWVALNAVWAGLVCGGDAECNLQYMQSNDQLEKCCHYGEYHLGQAAVDL